MKKKIHMKKILFCLTAAIGLLVTAPKAVNAEEEAKLPSGVYYEFEDGEDFICNTETERTEMVFDYGKSRLGEFSVSGNKLSADTFGGVQAYGVSGELALRYEYDGAFHSDVKTNWKIISCGEDKIDDIELDKSVANGSIIVCKSENGADWELVSVVRNAFEKNEAQTIEVFTIPEEDVRKGTYYRVMVAYNMERAKSEKWNSGKINKKFLEVYTFHVSFESNPIVLRNMLTREAVEENSVVTEGFLIDKGGTDYAVTVKKDNENAEIVKDMETICEPGSYMITVTTDLKSVYTMKLKVTEGMELSTLEPKVYEGGKKDDYSLANPAVETTVFGMDSYTTLKIGQIGDSGITKVQKGEFTAYGMKESRPSLFLTLTGAAALEKDGWEICSDEWGKGKKEKIENVTTGSVKTGALIVQKSFNGTDWVQVEREEYSNGLYTTDFNKAYENQGDILIYTPDGREYLKGLYVRALYAYEVYQESTKTYKRYLEKYQVYLCSDELGAVTFHNLSAEGALEKQGLLKEQLGENEELEAQLQREAETLLSGSGTATGFTIDISENPTVTYKVHKDGVRMASVAPDQKFTEPGRYEIYLTSAVGSRKTVTIYVDDNSSKDALAHYFGKGFLTDKRIYDAKSAYPVYEGGKTAYHIEAVSDSYLPLSGTITNTRTGKTIAVSATREEKSGDLTEPGEYVAVFTTKQEQEDGTVSGDYRTFTFRFEIIEEGKAPGPKVNQESLVKYNRKNVSDSYPMYYGLTYPSAAKGYITLAFATKEAALAYAYEYEKGMVELTNGTYRYGGNLAVKEKEAFDSNWDLTEAVNHFAEQAVEQLYFDMTNSFYYITLADSVITRHDNLRKLELNSSVRIFAEGQKELLCSKNLLPSISDKPYIFLHPVLDGKQDSGYAEFKFVKDERGYDSARVVITDAVGKQYAIKYNEGVAAQLAEQKCPSGIVTVTERTVYGDTVSYQAVYIARGDNTAKTTLAYFVGGKEQKATIDMTGAGCNIEAEVFRITDIVDELDPYNLITVSDGKNSKRFVADQPLDAVWAKPGTYTVQVANRLGYGYSFTVTVTGPTGTVSALLAQTVATELKE